jgi:hypothetical protein
MKEACVHELRDFFQIVFDSKQRSASVILGEPIEGPDS